MKSIQGKEFSDGPRHNRQVIENLILENCTFESWARLNPDWSNPDPVLRPLIRNVTLRNTNAYSAFLEGVVIEDVLVDTTKAGKAPLFVRGNAYRHVTLLGRIGHLVISGKVCPPGDIAKEKQDRWIAEWDRANADYYATVDWALDITQASYGSLSISGIPSRLIRRNAENTAVVTRERALARGWRGLPLHRGLYPIVMMGLIDDGYEDVVLIACPRSKQYKTDLEDLQVLRDAGVAE